jgi:O-antigen ligase
MNGNVTHAPRNAMLLGIATTIAGAGVLLWRKTRRMRQARAIRAARPDRPGYVPVWAHASAIVASSASALLLLVREKT